MISKLFKRNQIASFITTLLLLWTSVFSQNGLLWISATDQSTETPASEVPKEALLSWMSQVNMPLLFGTNSDTFQIEDQTFYRITVPYRAEELFPATFTIYPGQWQDIVGTVKRQLRDNLGENRFISYSQMRPEVETLLDDQLATLIETVYQFCGINRDICLDDYTQYLLERLPHLSKDMQEDIYTVYKHLLITRNLEGSIHRDGHAEGLYYYAQTDPDWAAAPFPNVNSDTERNDTIQDRSCGIMAFNMVAATYLHHEIDPLTLADYAVENGYRVEAHGVEDTFFYAAAEYYSVPSPTIYYARDGIDWDYIISKISDDHAMAIVHEYTGPFTSRQHYMVLEGYEVIDGVGYFLVADPYELRSRYSRLDQLLDPNTGNDGLIYATPEVIRDTCSAVSLFDADKTAWDLSAHAQRAESICEVTS